MLLPFSFLLLQTAGCTAEVAVVNSLSQQAVPKAEVTFLPDSGKGLLTRSQADGVARAALPAGEYRIRAQRRGFAEQYADHKFACRSGEKMDARLALMPLAAVRGRLLDEDGEPAAGQSISLLRRKYSVPLGVIDYGEARAETNDNGEFYLSGLPAGRYFLRADFRRQINRSRVIDLDETVDRSDRAVVYFPGVPTREQATAVVLAPGQEFNAGTLQVRLVPDFHVRLRVTGMETPGEVQLSLWPGPIGSSALGAGKFEFTHVPAGEYQLQITRSAPHLLAWLRLLVTGDIDGLEVPLPAPVKVSGVVKVEGVPEPEWNSIDVQIRSFGQFRPGPGGKFEVSGAPGTTIWSAARAHDARTSAGYYLAALRWNGADLPGRRLEVLGPVSGVEVIVRADMATVRFGDGYKFFYRILKAENEPWSNVLLCNPVDKVPPGDYLAFALGKEDDLGLWEEPDWLRDNLGKMLKVSVKPNATLSLTPPLLTGGTQN